MGDTRKPRKFSCRFDRTQKLESGPTKKGKESILSDLNYLNLNELFLENEMSGVRSGTLDQIQLLGNIRKIPTFLFLMDLDQEEQLRFSLSQNVVEFILEENQFPHI